MIARLCLAILIVSNFAGCRDPGRGYVESEFDLVFTSRFPKFFDPPPGAIPRYYKGRVTIYRSPESARIVIRDPRWRTVFDQQGTIQWHPLDPKDRPAAHYPNHTIVSFDGRVDILEQRQMEPKLYLSDDKTLWDTITNGT